MFSTTFRQTRPIIYLVLIGFLTLFYWVGRIVDVRSSWDSAFVVSAIGAFLLLILSVFLMGWMSNENKISEYYSMPLLFYVWCFVLFPVTLGEPSMLGGQFIVMFSAYKLLGIKDDKKSVYVFFDSGVLIMLASWFDPWSLVFLLPLFISILMHNRKQLKDWLALIAGMATIALIFYSIGVVRKDPLMLFRPYGAWLDNLARFPPLTEIKEHVYAWGFIILTSLLSVYHIIRAGHQTSGRISPVRLIASYIGSCLLLMVLNYADSDRQVLYSFFAVAFFLSRLFESFRSEKTREIILLSLLALPFIKLILAALI